MRIAGAAILLAALAVVPVSGARSVAGGATFADQRGETPGGPDIARVLVSNDHDGLVTFRILVADRPALGEDMRIRLWIDADRDTTTGLTAGADRLGLDLFLLWDAQRGAGLFRCTGPTCSGGADAARAAGMRFSYRDGVAAFILHADELGSDRLGLAALVTAGVRYDPATREYDLSAITADVAPHQPAGCAASTGSGICTLWRYAVRRSPLLRTQRFTLVPAVPRAGKRLVVRASIRTHTGAAVGAGQVACAARVAGKPVEASRGRFAAGTATCVFSVPATAAGKLLRGTIVVTAAGSKLTKSFARFVR